MKTGEQTTYIFLERGVEDKKLYKELCKTMGGLSGAKKFIKNCPLLFELRQKLGDELAAQGFFE